MTNILVSNYLIIILKQNIKLFCYSCCIPSMENMLRNNLASNAQEKQLKLIGAWLLDYFISHKLQEKYINSTISNISNNISHQQQKALFICQDLVWIHYELGLFQNVPCARTWEQCENKSVTGEPQNRIFSFCQPRCPTRIRDSFEPLPRSAFWRIPYIRDIHASFLRRTSLKLHEFSRALHCSKSILKT